MKTQTLTLILVALAAASCGPPPSGPVGTGSIDEQYLPQREIFSVRSFSGLDARGGRLILDAASWKVAFDSIMASVAPGTKNTLPEIDFNNWVVLIAAAGSTPTQLVSFQIAGVRGHPAFLQVIVELKWPGCGSLPVETTPLHIVAVPRVATEAQFTFENKTVSC
jgi:hypothetical protein